MAGLLSEGIDHLGRLVRRLIERRRPASPPARRRIETAPDDIKRSIA